MYAATEEALFEGQVSFRSAVKKDFEKCFAAIQELGFQTGWKRITGKPQHGNYNPNWVDCLLFLQKSIALKKCDTCICPDLPIANGLPVDRSDFDDPVDFWFHMYEVALLHKEVLTENRSGKRDGTILRLYNERLA